MTIDKEHKDIQVYPYIASIDDKVVHVAEGFTQLTGFTKEELIGKTLRETTALLHMNMEISDIIFESNLYIFTKDLEARNVQVIKGESSTDGLVFYFGEGPYSRLDEKFPAIQQFYKDNVIGIAIFKMPEIILLKANQTWLDFLDKPYDRYENSAGKSISEIATGWKGSTAVQIWKDLLEDGKPFRNYEFLYDKFERGATYWDISLTPVKENGLIKYAIEVTTDITEKVMQKKKLEEQTAIIQNRNEYMKAILENMADGIFTVDKEGNIVEHNQAAKQLFYNSQENRKIGDSLVYTRYKDNNGNDIAIDDMPAMKILRGETVKPTKITVERPDGTFHYNVSGSPIYDENRNIIEALICCSNITEYILHQEDMIEAQIREKKNLQEVLRLKDEFLYLMSHEFKTPLTVINAAIQALEHMYRDEFSDRAFEMIKKIKQNALRQFRIINNILDITRIDAGRIKINRSNMDIVVLVRMIVESVSLFAQQKGVELVFEALIDEKIIGIDEEKLERVLLNLLSNAIKFTSKGKLIFVRVNIIRQQGNEMACIEVADQGIGIPFDKQRTIFERFGQVENSLSKQAEGTGIGLYLSKLLVDHMGGNIQLESELGVGSTFRIMLPAKMSRGLKEDARCFDSGSKLVEQTAIEFSDIYQ